MALYEINNLPEPIDFEGCDTMLRRTLQNCKNLLMCRMGEVPYDRMRGFDPALYDLPMSVLRHLLLPEMDRIMLWEPDAEVVSASCALNDAGAVVIRCVVEIDL